MSARTTAKEFFKIATELPIGKKISKTFETKNAAKSFRVSLYRVKNIMEAFDIAISIEDNTVILMKEGPAISYTQINEDGSKEQKILLIAPKMVEEAIKRIEVKKEKERIVSFNDPLPIEDKIELFNKRVKRAESSNEDDMFIRQELRQARNEIFRGQEEGVRFPKNKEGRMTFARFLTEEEKLNETN